MAAPRGTLRSTPDNAPCLRADLNRRPSPGGGSYPVTIGRRLRGGHLSERRRPASMWMGHAPPARHHLARTSRHVRRPFPSEWRLIPAQVPPPERAAGGIRPERRTDRSRRLAVSRDPVSRFRRPTRSLHWAGRCRGRHRRRGSARARRFPPAPARRHRPQRSPPSRPG